MLFKYTFILNVNIKYDNFMIFLYTTNEYHKVILIFMLTLVYPYHSIIFMCINEYLVIYNH